MKVSISTRGISASSPSMFLSKKSSIHPKTDNVHITISELIITWKVTAVFICRKQVGSSNHCNSDTTKIPHSKNWIQVHFSNFGKTNKPNCNGFVKQPCQSSKISTAGERNQRPKLFGKLGANAQRQHC